MSKNTRTILTWTWCCRRAQWLKKHQPSDYNNLVSVGTDRFIPGYWVYLDYGRSFRVLRGKTSSMPEMVRIEGRIDEHGEFWTIIRHKLTPTGYRKTFWDKYMPVSFPDGIPSRGSQANAVFHAPNGHTHEGWVKLSDRRNDPASFSVQGYSGVILIRDASGKLVTCRNMRDAQAGTGRPDESDDAIELVDFHGNRQETFRNFPASRDTGYAETIGDFPGACRTRADWMKSIIEACNKGLMNLHMTLPLAARMWNAAHRFCQEHKDKGAYFVAYPMSKPGSQHEGRPCPVLAWNHTKIVTLEGKQERVPINASSVTRMLMPQIIIQWRGIVDTEMYRYNHPIHSNSLADDHFITMTLPPHGNELLYPKDHYAGLAGRVYPHLQSMSGERDWSVMDHSKNLIQQNDAMVVRFLERAYHELPIVVPSEDCDWHFLHSCGSGRRGQSNTAWSEGRKGGKFANWADHKDCVYVTSNWDRQQDDGPQIWSQAQQHGVGYAATPESAVAMVDEAMLIDSLPLS